MMDIIIILSLGIGIASGLLLKKTDRISKISSRVQTALLFVLIFLMGFNIGNDKQLIASLGKIGLNALIFALTSALGSFLLTILIFKLINKRTSK